MSPIDHEDSNGLLHTLEDFVELLASGRAHEAAQPFFAGANLAALRKPGKSAAPDSPAAPSTTPDEDVRPIAVGEVLRRLVAKRGCKATSSKAEEYLRPRGQMGVAVHMGMEAMVQAVRGYARAHRGSTKKVVLKIDYKNAFNSVDRVPVLREVKTHFPELYNWAAWCYRTPSSLFYGDQVLQSSMGVQQGDPLGPLFFCLAIQPIVDQVREATSLDLCTFYLDDGVLAGDLTQVALALERVTSLSAEIGLEVRLDKCEVITFGDIPLPTLQAAGFPVKPQTAPDGSTFNGPGAIKVLRNDFELLGAPIGSDAHAEDFMAAKMGKIDLTLQRLSMLADKKVAYDLLRYCDSYCKMVHYMRCAPGVLNPSYLRSFDLKVRHMAGEVLGLPPDDDAWDTAKLAIRLGGLGLRSSDEHREAAALASISGTFALAKEIWPDYSVDMGEWRPLAEAYNRKVGQVLVDPLTFPEDGLSQRSLSQALEEAQLAGLLERLPPAGQARLRHFSLPYASAWITAPPREELQQTSVQFQVNMRHRLGMPVYDVSSAPTCNRCGAPLDTAGMHGLTCKFGGRQSEVHDATMAALASWTKESGLHGCHEKRGLVPGSAARPADVWLPHGFTGKHPVAIDGVFPNPLAKTYLKGAARQAGYAAAEAENRKRAVRQQQVNHTGAHFVPFAVEYLGGFGEAAANVTRRIARLTRAGLGRGNAPPDGRAVQYPGPPAGRPRPGRRRPVGRPFTSPERRLS